MTTENANGNFQEENNNNLTSVERIKKDYQELKEKFKLNKLDSTKITYENDEVIFYKENDYLKIIKHSYVEHSHFSSEENFFIKDGNLFFAYVEEVVWNFDLYRNFTHSSNPYSKNL